MNRIRTSLLLPALLLTQAGAAVASATWYVNGVTGSDSNNCTSSQTACRTIGHAISRAASGDFIMVAASTYNENPTISISLEVIGSGAATAIIDGGGTGTVVTISSASAHVTLSGLTIRNGSALNGGGISNGGILTLVSSNVSGNTAGCSTNYCYAFGGGIYNNGGTVTINNSTISGNRAWGPQNRAAFSFGGGISNDGTLTINNSTLSGNWARFAGGGISNDGTLRINNSTLNGNHAGGVFGGGQGGGIAADRGTLTINNSTLSGNSTSFRGQGGGIFIYSSAVAPTLQNSIVANSPGGSNCYGTMNSNGYNLSSDNTCKFSGPGDLNNTDPKLGTLGYYGGPTQTIPLLSGSPAIDAGNPSGCTDGQGNLLKTDQRGMPRPDREDRSGCDMGAYESQRD
jgi:hypothetical protein